MRSSTSASPVSVVAAFTYGPWSLEARHVQQIQAISPWVRATEASQLFARAARGDTEAARALDPVLLDAEVLFTRFVPRDLLRRAPNLRWVHVGTAGVDIALKESHVLGSGVTVTCSIGMHAVPVSEFILSGVLALNKRVPAFWAEKEKRVWRRAEREMPVVQGATMGIVGYGQIGRATARLAKAFRMRVVATKRSCTAPMRDADGADLLLPPSHLRELLAESDYVVICAPLTPETERLIGEAELRAMKPTACLVNIARGRVVDEAALVRALREGRIAGAVLDVFEDEPLPADSPLWDMPNVIFSPHIAGGSERNPDRATDLFCRNLANYLSGQPLVNVVDPARGY
ncbi:MAG: D-2-hydroxyacid dehydrogenase [Dehalococcoidia bacterium]|nr:D-2-hydroxyacid dehydrogenase [Dehalococcoidia bacterium]